MSGSYEFATAGRILFGAGRLRELGGITRGLGCRILLVTGSSPERAGPVCGGLEEAGCSVTIFPVPGEPTIELVELAAACIRSEGCEVVVGFGGGSVIDAAKAAAALATNHGPVRDYLEVIGAARPLEVDPLPCIAAPTTAGTGAEVTRNAVLHSPADRVKVSLRSPRLFPRVALVDPEALRTLPADVMASTGMDALTQLIEAFLCNRANPLTDGLCREALPRVARSLVNAVRDRADVGALEDLAFGSLCSGMALTNAGLGAVHGLAAPLGGMFAVPHGAVCAALLWPVVNANLEAARQAANAVVTERFVELTRLLTGGRREHPEACLEWLGELAVKLGVPGLGRLGIQPADYPAIAERALKSSSMKGNPVPLLDAQLLAILRAAT